MAAPRVEGPDVRRPFVVLLALALSATAALTASAEPEGPGQLPLGPGGRATPNVSLALNLPVGQATGGAFHKGHYFLTASDVAWLRGGSPAATTGGLAVFDVAAPESPKPVGFLPLPHFQNEDLQISEERDLLVISQDRSRVPNGPVIPGRVYLIDVAVPQAPVLLSVTVLPAQVGTLPTGDPAGGPGHTASMVAGDTYLWLSGSRDRSVWVMDIRDPAAPTVVGSFVTPAADDTKNRAPGQTHDAAVDRFGDVWVMGTGGTALYSLTANPLKPRLLARTGKGDNARLNHFIHHGLERLDRDTVLVAEEDYSVGRCTGADTPDEDGSLQAWRIDRKAGLLRPLSTWDAPKGASDSGPLSQMCSSHWFGINGAKVVADAWYGAGVRFVDLSNPKKPRSIGMWAGDSTIAGQAKFVPGRDDLVYVADYGRGLDVVKIAAGGKGARTVTTKDEQRSGDVVPVPGLSFPVRLPAVSMTPHEDFGWACAVPSAL